MLAGPNGKRLTLALLYVLIYAGADKSIIKAILHAPIYAVIGKSAYKNAFIFG